MKPKYRRAVLGIALAIGMLGALPASVMAAQPVCGQTLTANTTLTANLNCSAFTGDNALNIGANQITVNLNGKTITGPAGFDNLSGVDTQGYNRTTVTNGTIRDYTFGVYSDGSNRTTGSFLTIDGNDTGDAYGIYQSYGVKGLFHHLTVVDTYEAVYMEYSATTTVRNSNLTGSDVGIYNYETTANVVSSNTLTGGNKGVYDYRSHRNSYTGNRSNGGTWGFYFQCDGYGQVNVNGNTANNNSEAGFYLNQCYVVGHPLDDFIGSRIVNNTANGNNFGFGDYDSYNELWRGNTANDNDNEGFYFDYPSGHRIVYNKALRNGDGIYIQDNYSYYDVATLSYNTARRNDGYGLYADYGADGQGNVATLNGTNCYNVDC